MADVIQGGVFLEIDSMDETSFVEEWTFNAGGDVHESRPSDAGEVKKDGGIPNDTISFTWVDQGGAFFQYLFANRYSKVPYEARPNNAPASGTNPKLTGNAVLELGAVTFENGGIIRGTGVLHCDGTPLLGTSP